MWKYRPGLLFLSKKEGVFKKFPRLYFCMGHLNSEHYLTEMAHFFSSHRRALETTLSQVEEEQEEGEEEEKGKGETCFCNNLDPVHRIQTKFIITSSSSSSSSCVCVCMCLVCVCGVCVFGVCVWCVCVCVCIVSHRVTYCFTSCHIVSHIVSHRVTSCHIVSHRVTLCHIVSRRSCHIDRVTSIVFHR